MPTGTPRNIPPELKILRERFDRWRSEREGHRIPELLWAAAVDAAARYSLHATSQTLGVGFYELRKRLRSALVSGSRANAAEWHGCRPTLDQHHDPGGETAMTEFVELTTSGHVGGLECVVELENRQELKMRMQVKGLPLSELVTLCRSLWSMGS